MTLHRVLSIDSGISTGIALGEYGDEKPYTLVSVAQIEGGLSGFLEWVQGPYRALEDRYPHFSETRVIAEKFTPINHSDYALTIDSVEPLRIEGAMVALGIMPDYPDERWRRPAEMYFAGGVDLADKKRRAHAMLKSLGMRVTGKMVGCRDANDARSAILHGIAYVLHVEKSKATFDMVSNWKGGDDGE